MKYDLHKLFVGISLQLTGIAGTLLLQVLVSEGASGGGLATVIAVWGIYVSPVLILAGLIRVITAKEKGNAPKEE